MRRKRIVGDGCHEFRMPIAGVIWQHVHYLVGLQQAWSRRLLHRSTQRGFRTIRRRPFEINNDSITGAGF